MTVCAVGISHRTARLELRERLALLPPACDMLAEALRAAGCAEAVALSTCNRTEVYVRAGGPARDVAALAMRLLCERAAIPVEQASPALYRLRGRAAARHLFRVVSGLDSLVLGEKQIRAQVRDAYVRSRAAAGPNGGSGLVLSRMFEASLRAASRVRRETRLNAEAASVPAAAVLQAARTLGSLEGRCALVLGAGSMSGVAARSLRAAGVASLEVASRAQGRAAAIAERYGGTSPAWHEIAGSLARADVVVSVTTARSAVLTRADLAAARRHHRGATLVVLDLAVPRDVDPDVRALDGVILFDLDDLGRMMNGAHEPARAELQRAERIIEEELTHYQAWVRTRRMVPLIRALRGRAETMRQHELLRARRVLRGFSEEQLDAVDAVTRRLLNKVLHMPTARLRQAGAEGRSAKTAELARWLFSLDENGNAEARANGAPHNGNGNGEKA